MRYPHKHFVALICLSSLDTFQMMLLVSSLALSHPRHCILPSLILITFTLTHMFWHICQSRGGATRLLPPVKHERKPNPSPSPDLRQALQAHVTKQPLLLRGVQTVSRARSSRGWFWLRRTPPHRGIVQRRRYARGHANHS